MNTLLDLLFYLNLALLLMGHELDAIYRAEWRFFFAKTGLSDETAYQIFTALHVPVLVGMLWFLQAPGFQIGLDVFLIGHAGVHWLLRNHPLIDFDSWFSRLWIYGGGLGGGAHLASMLVG